MKLNASTFHKCHAALWCVLMVPAVTLWRDSVPFLVFVSVYAIIIGSLSGIPDKRTKCNYKEQDDGY